LRGVSFVSDAGNPGALLNFEFRGISDQSFSLTESLSITIA
jgi:hypothetical protein